MSNVLESEYPKQDILFCLLKYLFLSEIEFNCASCLLSDNPNPSPHEDDKKKAWERAAEMLY